MTRWAPGRSTSPGRARITARGSRKSTLTRAVGGRAPRAWRRSELMRVILAAIAIALVLGVAAGGGYYLAQTPVYQGQRMVSVRVGDPGSNLVGQNWSGDPPRDQSVDSPAVA